VEGGWFPAAVVSSRDREVASWLEEVVYLVPVAQRPVGYHPLGIKHLDPEWIRRLGISGRECYSAILTRDAHRLGASLNECMACWEAILPHTVRHRTIQVDLVGILQHYQAHYLGAMYSGCGGGYLYVVSERPVPGGIKISLRLAGSSTPGDIEI
jgi:hypothetical protein